MMVEVRALEVGQAGAPDSSGWGSGQGVNRCGGLFSSDIRGGPMPI